MAAEAFTPGGRRPVRRAALFALVAAAIALAGCEQLKAIGAMVGLGGEEPQAAASPPPRPPRPATAAPSPRPAAPASARPGPSPVAQTAAAAPSAGGPAAKPAASPAAPAVTLATAAAPSPEPPGLPAANEAFDPTGKRDPFRPYVTAAELAARRSKDQLPPLQKLELSQLRLIAIVWGMRQNHAMVEDPAGVGYVLRVGTRVGPNGGRVARIAPDAVYVEETFRDATGAILTNQITLRLPERNPGGKGS